MSTAIDFLLGTPINHKITHYILKYRQNLFIEYNSRSDENISVSIM